MKRYTQLVSTPPFVYFNMVYPQIRVDIINTSIDVVVAKFIRKYEGNQCVSFNFSRHVGSVKLFRRLGRII